MRHRASGRRYAHPVLILLLGVLATISCGGDSTDFPRTAQGAQAFMDQAEQRLLGAWIAAERAAWVKENFITDDTELIEAEAAKNKIAVTVELAQASTRFDGVDLPPELRRKFRMLKTSLPLVAPADPAQQSELAGIAASLSSMYGKGKYCPGGNDADCLDLGQLSRIMARSRDADELLEAWRGWRTVSPPMREKYRRFAELGNAGARDLGFADMGAMWRSAYDMPPDDFAAEVDRLWEQVRPLYEALHCHVRARLAETYGAELVPLDQSLPAHLLGNMWAQDWTNIYDLVGSGRSDPGFDLAELLEARAVDARGMVRYGERFFTSLGFEPLPETFWERSLFTQPADRDVVCHASAWDID